ncbi:hypothetical protein [Pseudogemmobacter bohemicus]|uniref:hypothetical protein n=1 Tax=Pseudogemmobacter bohemicus TaxID=2250708 RepID=UPI000DD4A2EC|nr:hypothetical protein [Pseudogemmobacter bohemicus]
MLRAFLAFSVLALVAPLPQVARAADGAGPVSTIALALRLYEEAESQGDALGMAVAVRLAGGIRLRKASHWQQESGRYQGAALTGAKPAPLRVTPDLLVSGAAWSGALLMAEEDEALSDVLYELPPPVLRGGVSQVTAKLEPGRQDIWTMPFPGQSPAEVAVFTAAPASETGEDAKSPPLLLWSVEDGAGGVLCPLRVVAAATCRFTPAENGFYRVVIANPGSGAGAQPGEYLLIAN